MAPDAVTDPFQLPEGAVEVPGVPVPEVCSVQNGSDFELTKVPVLCIGNVFSARTTPL